MSQNVRRGLLLRPLPKEFYNRDAVEVARALLGHYLVRRDETGTHIGRIVEVEAYLGEHDRAAHSSRGRTARTEVMFGPPGFAYVYLIYGMHCCMNVVVGPKGVASAVLLRALEPIENIEDRTNGPGLLCRALAIDRRQNGLSLRSRELFIAYGAARPLRIARRARVGVDYAGVWARRLLRFYISKNPFVSRP
jgi:DNA-3-methyladenine glycosylase